MRPCRKTTLSLAVAACFTLPVPAVHAADWINAGGGDYADGRNWSPSGLPLSSDTVLFDLGVSDASPYTVVFDRDITQDTVVVANDAVNFELGSNALTANQTVLGNSGTDNAYLGIRQGRASLGSILDVGSLGDGTLDIRNDGAASATTAFVGGFFPIGNSDSGRIVVDGSRSSLSIDTELNAGIYGKATIEVANGASVSTGTTALGVNAGSTATVQVDGPGSTWSSGPAASPTQPDFYVGLSGDASFSASGGATVTSSRAAVGREAGSTGELNLAGAGTSFSSSQLLHVGFSGKGTVSIKEGAALSSAQAQVGRLATGVGNVTLSGAGSTWSMFGPLGIGAAGSGTLAVLDGATVSNLAGSVGGQSTGVGTVKVSGAGSSWSNGSLTIGQAGDGTVEILDGASLSSSSTVVAGQPGGQGRVTVGGSGSSWANSGSLDIGGTSLGSGGSGSLDVLDGATVDVADRLSLWNNATLTVNGGYLSTRDLDTKEGTLLLQDGSISVDAGTFADTFLYVNGGNAAAAPTFVMRNGATGSLAENGTNRIGFSRDGNLVIQSGAALALGNDITIGHLDGATGSVVVEGNGSRLELVEFADNAARNEFMVGRAGEGGLLVRDGGNVSTGSLHTWVGQSSSGTGTITVDGPASFMKTADLDVGYFGQGTLIVRNGATVNSGPTAVGGEAGGDGTVTVTGAGSFFGLDDGLVLGGTAGAAGGSGVLDIGPGATVSVNNDLRLWSGGTVALNGGTLQIDTLDNDGSFDFNAGTLKTTADFNVGELGTLTDLSVLKHLDVGGTATLDGSSILALNGGSLTAGAVFNGGGLVFNSGSFRLTDSNLVVGNGGLFGSLAQFSSGQSLIVDKTTTVNDGSTLQVDNTEVFSQVLVNDGVVGLSGLTARINGGDLVNNGLLVGAGRIGSSLSNGETGEVRVTAGNTLTFDAAKNTNSGTVRLLGGIAEFTGALTNSKTGQVLGNGVIIADGGLANQGEMSFSGLSTDVFGDVNHTGSLRVSGNSVATFYNDFANNGSEFRVSNGSTAVFFGAYSGGSSISGLGTVLFDGTVNFGNSPGRISIGGDVVFGSDNELIVELAGTAPGIEYDQLLVSGKLVLGGALRFVLLDDFVPADGDVFEALIADGGLSGDFAEVFLPQVAGYEFQLLRDARSLSLSAQVTPVPLPAAAWLFLGALGLLATRAGRRRVH